MKKTIPLSNDIQASKGSNDLITASATQFTDQAVVFTGRFTEFNGGPASRIARVNYDGSTDVNFISGTGFNISPTSLIITRNDIIVAAGDFTSYNGTAANRIVGLSKNGSVSANFHTGTGFDAEVTCVVQQSDGKVIVAGKFTQYNGAAVLSVVRLNEDGTLDNTFAYAGIPGLKDPERIAVQADGKIILAYTKQEEVDLYRLHRDGSTDASYFAQIPVKDENEIQPIFPKVLALLCVPEGEVLIGGVYYFGNSYGSIFLERADASGKPDPAFHSPFGKNVGGTVRALSIQDDRKIIVGGKGNMNSNGMELLSNCLLLRLNPDGSTDNSFVTNNTLRKNGLGVFATLILNDGKIVASGLFPEFNTLPAHNIVWLNTDGSVDVSFNKASAAKGAVRAGTV